MKRIHILLVEDNEGDILLTTEALEDSNMHIKLSVVKDGKQAIDFMNKQSENPEAEMPNLVLLDINLPRKNGHEVLKYIKENKNLKDIPVVMLTTSSSQKDVDMAYKNAASSYLLKPLEVNDLLEVVDSLKKHST